MSLPDPKIVVCCACGITKKFQNGNDILGSNWDLEEDKDGKCFDLCPSCRKRQDGQNERDRQRMGLPAQKIAPFKPALKDCVEPLPEQDGIIPIVSRATLIPTIKSNVLVRARFKLVSIDVCMGDKIIKGKKTEAIKLDDEAMKNLILKKEYYINL